MTPINSQDGVPGWYKKPIMINIRPGWGGGTPFQTDQFNYID